MTQIALEAAARDRAGKGVARQLRRQGRVPAVIYGDGKEPILISLDANRLHLEHRKGHMATNLCNLSLDSGKHLVIARDIALHPVTDVIEHIDFLRVSQKTRVTVPVPIHIVGQEKSPGLHKKGIITYATHEIELDCQATSIPEHVEIDVSELDIGDVVHAGDLKLPNGTRLAPNMQSSSVLSIEDPHMAAEPEPTEVAAAAADVPATAEAAKDEAGKADEGKDKK